MPSLYPSQGILRDVLSSRTPFDRSKALPPARPTTSQTPPPSRFTAWSAADDIKGRANALSEEAQKEIAKASSKAQAKAGAIELYSPKYYAACTFGGLLACVSGLLSHGSFIAYGMVATGPHPYGSDTA